MEERLKTLSRGMQVGMLGVALAGAATDNLTWVPAALISIFVSTIPTLVRKDLHIVLPIELNFLLVLALFLHVVGGFSGFYDNVPGWDHITHAMSSSLIAVLGFVAVVTVDKYVGSIFLPRMFLAFFIVMFTMAFGVLWELMEFANDQLTGSNLQYNLEDSMLDLIFDGLAGLVVASLGAYYLTHTAHDHFMKPLDMDVAKKRISQRMAKRKKAP